MRISRDKYPALADKYMMLAGVGDMFSGMLHNLNNHVQILEMQHCMLKSRLESRPQAPASEYAEKMERFSRELSVLAGNVHTNSEYVYYTRKEPAQINLGRQYADWILDFWRNNLHFKHRMNCTAQVECRDVNLELPPFCLTICLEQGIRNAVEDFRFRDPEQEREMALHISSYGEGGAFFRVDSQTALDEPSPWEEGSSSKPGHLGMGLPVVRYICSCMGWSVDLKSKGNETRFELQIPAIKSSWS